MEKYNDNELLYLIEEHDEIAREMLFNKYLPLIKSKVNKIGLNGTEKEEFIQEGLIMLSKAINTYNEKFYFSFNQYFNLLLTRRFIDLIRKKKKTDRIVYIENIDDYFVENSSNNLLIEENLKLDLSKFEKIVFENRFINGKKPHEIASELSVKVKQVYDAIDRIKKKSRKKY